MANANPIISTKRLQLRPLAVSDAKRIANLAGNWDVAKNTARIPFPYPEAKAVEWINNDAPGEVVYGICHDTTLIGCCGYSLNSPGHKDPTGNETPSTSSDVEIGYWLGQDYWGQGFATEAAEAILALCKERGFRKILSGHFADNPASGQVLKKLGFQYTGQVSWWGEARQEHALAKRYELILP